MEVIGHEENSLTGRVTIHVQTVRRISDNEIQRGPVKSYGIDPDALNVAHEGDVDKWLQWVKCRHQRFGGLNQEMVSRVASLKGRKL